MPFLIDLTDERFKTADNAGVVDFIRRTNPFAHSDVGDRLFRLGEAVPKARAYCPAIRSLAYVILHTDDNRIFAIAYGMRGLAFRLPGTLAGEATADGGSAAPDIGVDWFTFDPWPAGVPKGKAEARLRKWCSTACRAALAGPDIGSQGGRAPTEPTGR